jgi:hypothetical protein
MTGAIAAVVMSLKPYSRPERRGWSNAMTAPVVGNEHRGESEAGQVQPAPTRLDALSDTRRAKLLLIFAVVVPMTSPAHPATRRGRREVSILKGMAVLARDLTCVAGSPAHVLELTHRFEVIRVDTGAIAAKVIEYESVRYRPAGLNVRNSVRREDLARDTELAVPARRQPAEPSPTVFIDADLLVELRKHGRAELWDGLRMHLSTP